MPRGESRRMKIPRVASDPCCRKVVVEESFKTSIGMRYNP